MEVFYSDAGRPSDVRQCQECLRSRGVWAQGEGGVGGTVTNGSVAEVSSQALGTGVTVASEVEKGGASTALPVGGQQDDLL
jgi:hypothetical protein